MPTLARACSSPGCPRTTTRGPWCDLHAAKGRPYDARRESAARRGYDHRHRIWRRVILARDPICKDPYHRHPDQRVASTVADHVVPPARGGTWETSNGQGLCASCHGYKCALEDGGFGRPTAGAAPGGRGGRISAPSPAEDRALSVSHARTSFAKGGVSPGGGEDGA